ncbi:hypothetical protein BC827DRAFT_1387319 [Russula dissimulans]|nr:hypothetical protein BC827DRAFT_1387319 [Russula dissimulans]
MLALAGKAVGICMAFLLAKIGFWVPAKARGQELEWPPDATSCGVRESLVAAKAMSAETRKARRFVMTKLKPGDEEENADTPWARRSVAACITSVPFGYIMEEEALTRSAAFRVMLRAWQPVTEHMNKVYDGLQRGQPLVCGLRIVGQA